ncbi:MAG: response regulator [Bacteroidota bacterium]|nr:response regulator [Bacteroidota bacterium]MDP4232044.1 response regulator [Bacteroidota bacterium]MDP4241249.1 response regulator [Bacteroidota bacterium]MDP4286641.1 response regulator [Bacteroidota bacterium]
MSPKIRILYVEDHADTLHTISYALARQGFEVLNATSVASGITVGIAEEFDILVADIILPDGDGWDVLKTLRETKSFPAIALTGHSQGRAEILAHGFDLCVLKPFHISTLVAAVMDLFRASESQH